MSRYPRPKEGLVFIPVADGYIVEGGPQREHLTGRFARDVLPALFRLMDGTRTVEQIGHALGLPVDKILGVLIQRDLVRFQAEPDSHPLSVFMQRSLPAWLADGVWWRLRTARVTVTGDHLVAELLAGLLRESGVGTVSRADAPADLTIAVPGGTAMSPRPPSGAFLPVQWEPVALPIGGALPIECDPARAAITAGAAAGVALRYLGGYRADHRQEVRDPTDMGVTLVPTSPAKRYLTERRLSLRRSPHPRIRTISWILAGWRLVPAAGPGGGVRAYLLGDLTGDGHRAYAVDLAASALVELPGTPEPDGDGVTLVLTCDHTWPSGALRETAARLLHGDTGLLIAQIADDARSAGWRVRIRDVDGHAELLDLDPQHERVTAVLELVPVRRVARPSRRGRRPAGRRFGDQYRDWSRVTRLADLGLARADEIWPYGRIRYACHPRDAVRWIDHYLDDRALSPAAVLLFTAEPDASLVTKAAVAAGTVHLMAASRGIESGLLAGLAEHDPHVLYGCALGNPGQIPARIVR
jgi:hypothetical protein